MLKGTTYEQVRTAVINAFQNQADPANAGAQVVLKILRKEELRNVDGSDSLPETVDLASGVNMHATFVATGPGFRHQDPVAGVGAIDVAPTLSFLPDKAFDASFTAGFSLINRQNPGCSALR